jgi:hypothetical protein
VTTWLVPFTTFPLHGCKEYQEKALEERSSQLKMQLLMIDGLIKWSALISYWSNEKDSELTKCFLCVTDDFI